MLFVAGRTVFMTQKRFYGQRHRMCQSRRYLWCKFTATKVEV
jgi:hypothetical protein